MFQWHENKEEKIQYQNKQTDWGILKQKQLMENCVLS